VRKRGKSCYYRVLGVSIKASIEEIKRAFRVLALRWHPDRNPGKPEGAERFREALEAYETLVNPRARSRYDRLRGYVKSRKNTWREMESPEDEAPASSFDEILQDVFGICRGPKRPDSVHDLRFDLQVPVSTAVSGGFEEISYLRSVPCGICGGARVLGGGGSCPKCDGEGEVEEPSVINVWIPPGSVNGTRVRVPGGGDRMVSRSAMGDLVVVLHVV